MAQRVGERDVGIFPSGNPPIYTTSTIVLSASVPILSSLFLKRCSFLAPQKPLLIISRAREKNHFDILMRGSVLQCMYCIWQVKHFLKWCNCCLLTEKKEKSIIITHVQSGQYKTPCVSWGAPINEMTRH